MRKCILISLSFALIICFGCSKNPSETESNNWDPSLPKIPVPANVGDELPEKSDEVLLKIGAALSDFNPYVEEIYDRTGYRDSVGCPIYDWITQDERIVLISDSCRTYLGAEQEIFINEIPRIAHKRYWKKVFSVNLDENTHYSQAHSVTYGISETNGQEFSLTIGAEVSAWFVSVKTEITSSVSYEIKHSTETKIEKTFSGDGAAGKITVVTVWQLVDKFAICNSEGEEVTENSKDLFCDKIRLAIIKSVDEASEDNFYLSSVSFTK
ncbi:MAG: hypothetical protein K8R79_08655 [Calditrichales bacterium]|nr:hypothetical protein [Calditrichales bacterium]